MMLTEQVCNLAAELAGELTAQQRKILEALCSASVSSLAARLRDGLTVEDCGNDFICAAGLMALAALHQVTVDTPTEQITAGDFTVRKESGDRYTAVKGLQDQAEQMMAPYLKDRFAFLGV